MKNLKNIIVLIVTSFILLACPADDDFHQECYICDNTLTEYCITEGEHFYTYSVNGSTATEVPLNGLYWSDIIAEIETECENTPPVDCFICNVTNTSYCYIQGNDYYTSTIDGEAPVENMLNGIPWPDIKFDLEQNCPDSETDCYTCGTTSTEYCYTINDTFYTTNVNGVVTQTELNGASWQDIRTDLESDCSTATVTDCYICDSTTTEYCYTYGETYYVTTVNGVETQTELNGMSWVDIKFDLEQACP